MNKYRKLIEKRLKNDQVEVNVDSDRNSSLEQQEHPTKLTEKELDFGLKLLLVVLFILLITWLIWPMSVYRDWIFTPTYFKGYVTVGLIWLYVTLIVIGVIPFYTGRHSMAKVFRGL